MHERCPGCGLVFQREPGYYTGAMVLSYAIGVPVLALLSAGVLWLTRWPVEWALLGADAIFLGIAPQVFRYSRILWIHFDQAVDPAER
ncbi:MAG: hypothetical protein H0V71_03400 [Chloroflexi bacterium]|nr:hypothetical protein [Chloroflexota bacterium]